MFGLKNEIPSASKRLLNIVMEGLADAVEIAFFEGKGELQIENISNLFKKSSLFFVIIRSTTK